MGYLDAYFNAPNIGITYPSVPELIGTTGSISGIATTPLFQYMGAVQQPMITIPEVPISTNLPVDSMTTVGTSLPVFPTISGAEIAAKAKEIASQIADRIASGLSGKISTTASYVKQGVSSVVGAISNFGRNMVAKARSFLGYNERNGSYKLFTQGRKEAWCADFVSYVARQCGKTGFNFPSVQGILNWGRRNNRFSKTPKVGDAIIFKGAGASHTGIVTRVANGRVYTVEGNTSDKVAERSYALSDKKITGYVTIA